MGQATAHALKLSGLLHRAQSTDRHVVTETVVLVMESEDQRIVETNTCHEVPRQEAKVLIRRSVPDSTHCAGTLHFTVKLLRAIKKSSRFLVP